MTLRFLVAMGGALAWSVAGCSSPSLETSGGGGDRPGGATGGGSGGKNGGTTAETTSASGQKSAASSAGTGGSPGTGGGDTVDTVGTGDQASSADGQGGGVITDVGSGGSATTDVGSGGTGAGTSTADAVSTGISSAVSTTGAGSGGAPTGSTTTSGSGGGVDTGAGGGSTGSGGGGSGGGTGVPLDPALLSRCTGTNPILCTIPVAANGNYTITVDLGSPSAASVSRVQAELLRIVVPQRSLPAGQFSSQTFSANVRAEKHDGYSAPGLILNLRIDAPAGGPAPALHGLGVVAAKIPTIFLAGDSTVCDWDPALATILSPVERGWGQEVSQYLKPTVAVADYADSGETAGSFYTKFFTPQERAAMQAGDYLFIQFGHNDQKNAADVTNYQANLMKYITDARTRNVTPVLFTPVARKGASAGNTGFAGLDQQVRTLAASQKVALVDLTNLAIAYYRTVPNLSALFATPTEGTHFSETGATQIAGLVANALKTGTTPLSAFVK